MSQRNLIPVKAFIVEVGGVLVGVYTGIQVGDGLLAVDQGQFVQLSSSVLPTTPGGAADSVQANDGAGGFKGAAGAFIIADRLEIDAGTGMAFIDGLHKGVLRQTPSAARVITIPDATDTVALLDAAQAFTNKIIDATLNTIENIENANVSPTAGIDGTKIDTDFGNQDLEALGDLLIGPTPRATTGQIRFANVFDIRARNAADDDDLTMMQLVGAAAPEALYIGTPDSYAATRQVPVLALAGATSLYLGVSSSNLMALEGGFINAQVPIVGWAAGSSPFGVHGLALIDMNNANAAAATTEYCFGHIRVTSTANFTANRTLTFPAPATPDQAYAKYVCNTQGGAFSVVVSTGAGTTVTIAQSRGAWCLFSDTGVRRMTADSVF